MARARTPNHQNPSAIVLDLAHPRAVAVVQSLGRLGVDVVGVDHRPTATGFASRYLTRRCLLPSGADLEPSLDTLLDTLAREVDPAIIIPTSDDYLIYVARRHERLSTSFIVPMPP